MGCGEGQELNVPCLVGDGDRVAATTARVTTIDTQTWQGDAPPSRSSLSILSLVVSSFTSAFTTRFLFPPNASSRLVWTGGSPAVPKNLPKRTR